MMVKNMNEKENKIEKRLEDISYQRYQLGVISIDIEYRNGVFYSSVIHNGKNYMMVGFYETLLQLHILLDHIFVTEKLKKDENNHDT